MSPIILIIEKWFNEYDQSDCHTVVHGYVRDPKRVEEIKKQLIDIHREKMHVKLAYTKNLKDSYSKRGKLPKNVVYPGIPKGEYPMEHYYDCHSIETVNVDFIEFGREFGPIIKSQIA